jgi:hypothetical protein
MALSEFRNGGASRNRRGRPTLFKRGAMTAAERQKRHRKRNRKQRTDEVVRMERFMRREENAKNYIPSPPGITYWRKVRFRPNEEVEEMLPTTRPLAQCDHDLDDEEVLALLDQLEKIARARGLTLPARPTNDLPL